MSLPRIEPEDLPASLEERESTGSQDWQRVPSRSVDIVPAQTPDELPQIQRALAAATTLASSAGHVTVRSGRRTVIAQLPE
jgi:hypothetical protein